MYPNYNQYQDWARYQAAYLYGRNMYPNGYQQNMPVQYPMNGYQGYQVQNPYSYYYPGYTENVQGTGTEPKGFNGFNGSGIQKSVMNYFQDDQGQFDFDKMMSTTGSMMKTFQQVSPLVKGIGTFVKGIK
ncbi:YppG family protein [Halobacillus salinus]|uniref:YppG family protein n=1 Tax=Halobacillus salinus TaxID=192814 RepID=UPI00159042FF|nr:YppG family protein [Halobacillus salinus]